MLYVKPQYRHQKLATALETYAFNRALENGWIPYGQIIVGNEASMKLQESMGLHFSKSSVYWMTKIMHKVGKDSKNTCKSHESVVKYQCCE